MIINYCRGVIRKLPRLRKILLPLFRVSIPYLYTLRKIIGIRTIEVSIGTESVVKMIPEGHIAKMMWLDAFEKEERNFVISHLSPGMRVLNIGANTGLYTLIAAKLIGPKGVVHAFEPSTLNFSRLKRNVLLNELCNVRLNQIAVSDFAGTLAVMYDPDHPDLDSHYYVQRVADGNAPVDAIEFIPCDTVDNYWRNTCQDHLKKIDMIIIDVEGAELSVFKGALALLAASPNIVIMAECTERLDEIDELLRAQGFSFYIWNVAAACLEETTMKRGTVYAMRKH